jgi:hypothetical protein
MATHRFPAPADLLHLHRPLKHQELRPERAELQHDENGDRAGENPRPPGLLEAFAVHALAEKLAGAADGFGLLAGALLGGLLIAAAQFHLAENALALHLLLERAKRLIDIVVANQNVNDGGLLPLWTRYPTLGVEPGR